LWGGEPGRLIDAAVQQRIELVSSAALLADLQSKACCDRAEPPAAAV
jgi:hypothetical protein